MRAGILIAAILLGFLGFIFTETIIGAIIGIPMLVFGFILFIYGLVAKQPGRKLIVQSSNPSGEVRSHRIRGRRIGVGSTSPSLSPDSLSWTCTSCGRKFSTGISPDEVLLSIKCTWCGQEYDI